MTWSPSLLIGDARIDEQHKRLFDLLDAMKRVSPDEERVVVEAALDELRSYVVKHLRDEESLLASVRYKNYTAHCALHREFEATLAYLIGRLETQLPGAVLEDCRKFVSDWLVNHVAKEDLLYRPFITG